MNDAFLNKERNTLVRLSPFTINWCEIALKKLLIFLELIWLFLGKIKHVFHGGFQTSVRPFSQNIQNDEMKAWC
jgi:hypothetical protein